MHPNYGRDRQARLFIGALPEHVPTRYEEVDGLDFGSGHLAYQKRVGNALPAYKL